MRKDILFVAHDTSLFGANQSLLNMISSIKENKDITLRVVVPDNGEICSLLDKADVLYDVIKFKQQCFIPGKGVKNNVLNILRRVNNLVLNTLAVIRLRGIVKKYNINIIHSNSGVVAVGETLAKQMGICHVWHLREYIDLDHGLDIFGGFEKYKDRIRKSGNIICISKGIARHFNVGSNAIVLYNAVRKDQKSILKDKADYFLFCGSLVKNKGIEEALHAFSFFFKVNDNYKLRIAGTALPDYEEYLKALVTKLGISNAVEFLGFREDTDHLLANAQALLMCSFNEALGRVTIEAMLNFCLVIGFDNAGTSELINDGKNGLLFKNSEALISRMTALVNNDIDGVDEMRQNAYNFANANFLEQHFADKLIRYYDDCLNRHNS